MLSADWNILMAMVSKADIFMVHCYAWSIWQKKGKHFILNITRGRMTNTHNFKAAKTFIQYNCVSWLHFVKLHLHLCEILNYYALNSLSITAFQFKILEFKINIFHFISNIWQKIAFPINSLSFLLCIRGRGVDRIGNILKAEDFFFFCIESSGSKRSL